MRAREIALNGGEAITTFGFEEPSSSGNGWALVSSAMGFSAAIALTAGKVTVATVIGASAGAIVGVVGAMAWITSRRRA